RHHDALCRREDALAFCRGGGKPGMVASRNRPEGGRQMPFGLGILMLLLLTSEGGHQDFAVPIASEPGVNRSQKAPVASPFGTIHDVKLSMADASDSSIPLPLDYQLVGFDPNSVAVAASIRRRFLSEDTFFTSPYAGPMVDRSRKGDYGVARDRLIVLKGDRRKPRRPIDAIRREDASARARQQPAAPPAAEAPPGVAAATNEPKELVRPADVSEGEAASASETAREAALAAVAGLAFSAPVVDPSLGTARVYFGRDPMGQKLGTMEPWVPGEEPRFDDA